MSGGDITEIDTAQIDTSIIIEWHQFVINRYCLHLERVHQMSCKIEKTNRLYKRLFGAEIFIEVENLKEPEISDAVHQKITWFVFAFRVVSQPVSVRSECLARVGSWEHVTSCHMTLSIYDASLPYITPPSSSTVYQCPILMSGVKMFFVYRPWPLNITVLPRF